jgi:hypothetical protein
MLLSNYFSEADGRILISPEQASGFAKEVAGDFNPIHDADARRFCVPGDLLFALVLHKFGLSQQMTFRFHNMVGRHTPLRFTDDSTKGIAVTDDAGKCYLEAHRSGDVTQDQGAIAEFTRRYVFFSGLNFPHYLKPLMEANGVMFHPERPLVIYDSMGVSFQSLDVASSNLELSGSSMKVEGKRAEALLEFAITANGREVGTGSKKLIISGLRPYDPDVMNATVQVFYGLKAAFEKSRA